MLSIEQIKAKCSTIKAKRVQFYEKLEELQNALRDALVGVDVYAQSEDSNLGSQGPDEWVYGHISLSKGELTVAYRTTDDDYGDSMANTPDEYRSYHIKEFSVCPIEWLETLSSEHSISSLMSNLESAIQAMEKSAIESVSALDRTLSSQSNRIYEDSIKLIKELNDENLHRTWIKARNQISIDPAESITRTSSYLESVCRKIHNDLSEPLPTKKEMTNLIGSTIKILSVADNPEAERDLKQLFGGLKGIFQAIGSLRTHFGSAHGSSPGDFEINEHHARLANDAAATVSVFLFQIYKNKFKN